MTEVPDAETMKAFNKNIVDEFRTNGGVVGGPFEGATLLLLTSTGAKSGQPRLAPLAYLTIDGKMFIIGSKARFVCLRVCDPDSVDVAFEREWGPLVVVQRYR